MALWNATEISKVLGCSPQNVNQQKNKLRQLGYLEIDPVDNKEKINENGYNYLLNKRKLTMQMNSTDLNNGCSKDIENIESNSIPAFKQDTFVIDLLQKENENLKKQLEEEKNQTKHWQELYIQQNEDFKKITFPLMIGTEEQNKKQEENNKSFWQRLFNK